MARVITQETFDEVVKENIDEFEMSREEAVEEAVNQFKAQGVNLSNIIMTCSSAAVVTQTTKSLEKCLLTAYPERDGEVSQLLTILKTELDKELPLRVHAGKEGLYPILIDCLGKVDPGYIRQTLETLTSLMNGFPDLLDHKGQEFLQTCTDVDIVVQNLKWINVSATQHEKNRADLITMHIHNHLRHLLEFFPKEAKVIVQVCKVIKKLVCDDDVRVTHGNTHEHARALAKENLCSLVKHLDGYRCDAAVVVEILPVIYALVVREEFCIKVYQQDCVQLISDIMITYPEDAKINQHCLALLKALAGSDQVKEQIVQLGTAPLIIAAIQRHEACANVVSVGCVCISALALRSPQNSRVLSSAGAPELLTQIMNRWKNNHVILKHACIAIRNQVARCEELKEEYLELGVEEALNEIMAQEGALQFEAKGVLRDLGCAVKMEEQWRGQGQQLTN